MSSIEALQAFRSRCDGPFRPACDRCAPDPCTCPPCDGCGEPIVSDDPDDCHTPDTRRFHPECCPTCQGDPDA